MVWHLIRRDPAWRLAVWASPIVAVAMFIPGAEAARAGAIWSYLVFALFYGGRPNRRTGLFEAALPIDAHQVLLSRAVALSILAWLPAPFTAISLLIQGRFTPPAILSICAGAAVVNLTASIALSHRVSEFKSAPWVLVAATVPLLAATALLGARPNTASSIAILAVSVPGSLFALASAWSRVPKSFQAAPAEARESSGRAPAALSGHNWRIVFRILFPAQTLWILPALAANFMNWQFNVIMLGFIPISVRTRSRWLFPLPLSPRRMMWILIGPSLALLMMQGAVYPGRQRVPELNYRHRPTKSVPDIYMPIDYWKYSSSAVAPEIRSPWGEITHPKFEVYFGRALYNPYSVGPSNSRDFLAWQFRRAAEAAYGQTLTEAQLRKAVDTGMVREQWTPLMQQARFRVLEMAVMIGIFFLFQVLWAMQGWKRVPAWLRTHKYFSLIFAAPAILYLLPFFLPAYFPGSYEAPLVALHSVLLQISAALPPGWLSVIVAGCTLAGIPYWPMRIVFREQEDTVCARTQSFFERPRAEM